VKVLLLGATGMLGHAVYKALQGKYEFVLAVRDGNKLDQLTRSYQQLDGIGEWQDSVKTAVNFQAYGMLQPEYREDFFKRVGDVDYVINAIGITRPVYREEAFIVNSALPHILARQYGPRLIHISTDCVYSGTDGRAPYDEKAIASPTDIYGLTKSVGEPRECLTIRTSIIGRELFGNAGLLEWFLQTVKTQGTVNGYTDHLWNGITAHQYGLLCDKIMTRKAPIVGVKHVFSTTVSKYTMLLAFRERFNVKCDIIPVQTGGIDRRLGTVSGFNNWMKVPSFQEMLDYMPSDVLADILRMQHRLFDGVL